MYNQVSLKQNGVYLLFFNAESITQVTWDKNQLKFSKTEKNTHLIITVMMHNTHST